MDKKERYVYIYMCVYACVHTHMCVYIHAYMYTHINTHNGLLLHHEKERNLPLMTTWVDLEGILLSKYFRPKYLWNKSEIQILHGIT